MDMNFEKNASVKFEDYTKKFLQSDSVPATMEVVTRTNAVKSPTAHRFPSPQNSFQKPTSALNTMSAKTNGAPFRASRLFWRRDTT